MKNKSIILSALSLALVSFPAAAASITFNTLPPTQENGTYNGFLNATIDGLFANIICNDFYATTSVPSGPWEYSVSTLPGLTSAKFGSDDAAIFRYTVAAVLLSGDGDTLAGLQNVTDSHTISSYQYALWALFTPTVSHFGDSATLLGAAQNDALNPSAHTWTAAGNLRIYTPSKSASGNQEFLGMSQNDAAIATPEPGTTVLMGIGFLALSILGRKYTRVTQDRSRSSAVKFPDGLSRM